MSNPNLPQQYKSPLRKLVRFFERSRDQWKAKSQRAKGEVKRLTQRVQRLEQRCGHWQARVQALEAALAAPPAAALAPARALALAPTAQVPAAFGCIPRRHQYSVGQMLLLLEYVLRAATSLRGASAAWALTVNALELALACPSWFTVRLWLLRVGYYKLTRPKTRAADWVWIVDFTVQQGPMKCLLILGVRLSALPAPGVCLTHEDVEPLALLPLERATGTVVAQHLETLIAQTGVPREILGDHGPDVKAGVDAFCVAHPKTSPIYDIKHKTAAVLKHELATDATWLAFSQHAAQTQRQVQQTALAVVAPPSLRTKARYMNLESLVTWGQQTLALVTHPTAQRRAGLAAAQVKAKLGWLRAFRQPLAEWAEVLTVVDTVETYVRTEGLTGRTHRQVERRLQGVAHTPRARRVRATLLAFVAQEAAKAEPHERLLGSSEVIESVLGKLKHLEQTQAHSGFTGLVLSVCAVVSQTTQAVVQHALETVPTKQIQAWYQEHLGPTIQAQRKTIFDSSA